MQIASFVRDEVEEMFDRIDADGDKRISFAEYSELMLQIDHAKTDAALRSGFDVIDLDHDGIVSFDEFYAWIAR
jgi:Ca2+-binding EF-hand superfamily protein